MLQNDPLPSSLKFKEIFKNPLSICYIEYSHVVLI